MNFVLVLTCRRARTEYEVEVVNNSGGPEAVRPFRITFPPPRTSKKGKKRKAEDDGEVAPAASRPKLVAESYAPSDPGPYPQDKPPENPVRFTPVQVTHRLLPRRSSSHSLFFYEDLF